MPAFPPLPDPFYYLANFLFVLDWVQARYADLLSDNEHRFIEDFRALPRGSQALLTRMIMRKGDLFRTDKLRYEEIGDAKNAVVALLEHGWVQGDPPVTLQELFKLHTKAELAPAFHLEL